MSSIFPAITTDLVGIMMLIFTIYAVSNNTVMTKTKTNIYVNASLLTLLVIILEILTIFFSSTADAIWRVPHLITNILGFSLMPAIPLSLAFLYNDKLYKYSRYLCIPILIHTALCIASAWTGWFFTVSADNVYSRGPLFFINVVVSLYSFMILVYANQSGSKEMDRDQRIYLAMLYVLVLLGNVVQIIFPGILLIWVSVALSMLLYYNFLNEAQFKYDPTTGILNRHSFEKRLVELQKLDKATIVVFDLNNLKDINDSQGHFEGDNYLTYAAEIIRESFADHGTAYRIGGDEFCVLCSSAVSQDRLAESFNKIASLSLIHRPDPQIALSIAYGYSIYDKTENDNIYRSFAKADSAMYEHKLNLKSDQSGIFI
ncbi:MAG: GGDEF domain-containing protein [Saccharofermentanales bacterium]